MICKCFVCEKTRFFVWLEASVVFLVLVWCVDILKCLWWCMPMSFECVEVCWNLLVRCVRVKWIAVVSSRERFWLHLGNFEFHEFTYSWNSCFPLKIWCRECSINTELNLAFKSSISQRNRLTQCSRMGGWELLCSGVFCCTPWNNYGLTPGVSTINWHPGVFDF